MSEHKSILEEAHEITSDNTRGYESPQVSFAKIAKIASVLTGKELTGRDICFMFMAVKLQREAYRHKRDNLVDLAGYANLMDGLHDETFSIGRVTPVGEP